MSEGKQTALMPCPFCGGEARVFIGKDAFENSEWGVECTGSDCYSRMSFQVDAYPWDTPEETATHEASIIAAWNRRASPAFPALVEALRRQDGHLSILMGNIHGSAKVDHRWEGMEEVVRGWRAEIAAALAAASTDGGQ